MARKDCRVLIKVKTVVGWLELAYCTPDTHELVYEALMAQYPGWELMAEGTDYRGIPNGKPINNAQTTGVN